MENWMEELLDGIIEKKFEQNRRVSNCHQTIERSSIKCNLSAFQSHIKQAKIDMIKRKKPL